MHSSWCRHAPIPSLDGPGYWTCCSDGAAVPGHSNPYSQPDAAVSEDEQQNMEWVVEVTPATDYQGWMYGSHFQTLGSRREGGRAGRRPAGVHPVACEMWNKTKAHEQRTGYYPEASQSLLRHNRITTKVCPSTAGMQPSSSTHILRNIQRRTNRADMHIANNWLEVS